MRYSSLSGRDDWLTSRLWAHDLDAVEVVAVERVLPSAHVPGKDREHGWQERASPDAHGCDEIEPELEVRLGRDRKRKPLRVRVRAPVGDERECCAAESLHLEPRLHVAAPRADRTCDRHRIREIARTLAFVGAAHAVDAPDR